MTESFILCIAKNGLTDLFSQIWLCTLYAKTCKRSIVLTQTHYKGTSLFDLFDFSDYPVPVYDLSKILDVGHTGVVPLECKPLLIYDNDKIVEVQGGPNFPIDKTKEYDPEILIVYCDSGHNIDRVTPTTEFLEHIRFKSSFVDFLKRGIAIIPNSYNAVQIRHTDYKTNLPKILELLDKSISSTTELFYVATDNSELLISLKERYGERILCNDMVYDRKGVDILQDQSDRGILENAFLDLFILAGCSNDILYFYKKSKSPYYGYTRLADRLKTHLDLIDRLLA